MPCYHHQYKSYARDQVKRLQIFPFPCKIKLPEGDLSRASEAIPVLQNVSYSLNS